VERERPLDAHAERLLPDCKRLPRARPLAFDHDSFEYLDPAPLALDHLEVDAHGIARLEPRAVRAQLALLEAFDDAVHENGPRRGRR
jgi:hypothetical protein